MKGFKYLEDALFLLGAGSLVTGVAYLSIPAAFIVAGVLMMAMAFIVGKAKASSRKASEE